MCLLSNDCRFLVYPVVILFWLNQREGVSWRESKSALSPGEKHIGSGCFSLGLFGPDDHLHHDRPHGDVARHHGHNHRGHVSDGDQDSNGDLL